MDEGRNSRTNAEGIPAGSLAMVGDSLPAFDVLLQFWGAVHALASATGQLQNLGR